MKYTVNLYKADDKGFLVARACMKSALQLGGNNTRDTRLLSSEMPQWNYSPLYAPVPLDEHFYTKLLARDIMQAMPDLHNPEVARNINENELDLKVMRGILATDEKSYGGLFLQYLMSYPRWVNAKGEIEVGGEDYFAILEEAADVERKAIDNGKPSRMADKSRIATISDRAHKRMESLAAVPPEQLHEAFAEQERLKRGGIDETSTAFLNFVNIVGYKTGCNAAAGAVMDAIKRLLELLDTCNREDFNKLDTACNTAADALLSFGLALAERQDAEATAEINGERKSTSFADSLKRIQDGQTALSEEQIAHSRFLISLGTDLDEIKRNTRTAAPRSWDKQVSQPMAAQMLTDMGYSVSARQIQNWDRYIRTNGTKGTQPPEGYKIELRYHYETFKAWAELAAGNKRMKQGLRSRYQRVHKTNG